MDVNYIDLMNGFNRWLESGHLPALSQLLWYKLVARANGCGWPEWVVVDNLALMSLIQCRREATFIELRDKLVDAGLIEYRKGKKGSPNAYRIKYTFTSEVQSVVNSVVQTEVQSVVDTEVQTVDSSKRKLNAYTTTSACSNFSERDTADDFPLGMSPDDPHDEDQQAVVTCGRAGIPIISPQDHANLSWMVQKYSLSWIIQAAERIGDMKPEKRHMGMLKTVLANWKEAGRVLAPGEYGKITKAHKQITAAKPKLLPSKPTYEEWNNDVEVSADGRIRL